MSLEELQFLTKKNIFEKQTEELRKKILLLSQTLIGRELKLKENTALGRIPITTYDLYSDYFHSKTPQALMFPSSEYEEGTTTGTMGNPKRFLVSKPFIRDCLQTLKATFVASTLDNEKSSFQKGDVFYVNAAPRPFMSGVFVDYIGRELESYVKLVPPDQTRPFAEKTQYFVENYEKIQIASIPLVILFHQIYPKIRHPLKMKGFMPFDTAAEAHKEKVREIVGCRLSGSYSSTETCISTIPSVEHELGFIFDPRNIYCEFIPIEELPDDSSQIDTTKLNRMDQVKKGRRYLLVVTPFKSELVRYNTQDIVEIVDYGDSVIGTDMVVLKFFSRMAKVISIQNFASISETELLLALSRSRIDYVDFTAKLEVEAGRQYLALYLEPSKSLSLEETRKRIQESLRTLDPDFDNASKFFDYEPLKLTFLQKGAFSRMLATKKGLPKVDRVNMIENDFKRLVEA